MASHTASSDGSPATSSSSSPSASPRRSGESPPTLDRLLEYFVSAKRSLSATSHVAQANEIVTSVRTLLEDLAVYSTRNGFSTRMMQDQITTLSSIRDLIDEIGGAADAEFRQVIGALDAIDARLQKNVVTLKETVIDPSLQNGNDLFPADPIISNPQSELEVGPRTEHPKETQSTEVQVKSLFDFVDESKHVEVQTSIRVCIDAFNDARKDVSSALTSFDTHLRVLRDTVAEPGARVPNPADKTTIYDQPPTTMSRIFPKMEEHATEMATLLQSLVSHYDLCVTALKHTEGGGAAAKQAAMVSELPDKTAEGDESLYQQTGARPIDAAERAEMLRVLDNDARDHVDDVVDEIRYRATEVTTLASQLQAETQQARERNQTLTAMLTLLHEVHSIHLTSHLHALTTFQSAWTRIRTQIHTLAHDLDGYTNFYADFHVSYGQLLEEVRRRRAAETHVRGLARNAHREIRRAVEADEGARRGFVRDVGRFLPTDLWPGLRRGPRRWELVERGEGGEVGEGGD